MPTITFDKSGNSVSVTGSTAYSSGYYEKRYGQSHKETGEGTLVVKDGTSLVIINGTLVIKDVTYSEGESLRTWIRDTIIFRQNSFTMSSDNVESDLGLGKGINVYGVNFNGYDDKNVFKKKGYNKYDIYIPYVVVDSIFNFIRSLDLRAWYPFNESGPITTGYTPNVANELDSSIGRLQLANFGLNENIDNSYMNLVDGQAGSVSSISVPSLAITGDLTLIIWIRVIDSIVSDSYMIAYGTTGETEATNVLYAVFLTSAFKLGVFHEYSTGNNEVVNSNTILSADGNYHMVMIRRDATAKTYEFSVDNGVKEIVSYSNNPTGGSGSHLAMPRPIGWSSPHLDGRYYDVFIIAEKLTDAQITKLYNYDISEANWFNYSNWDSSTGSGYVSWSG